RATYRSSFGSIDRALCSCRKMCRCKILDDASAFPSHVFQAPLREAAHVQHQFTEAFPRSGIKGKSVFTFSHQIRHTAASIRNDYGQPRCHGFIDHKTPLFRNARVHEHISERIVGWQFSILNEARQVDATMQPEVRDQATEISLERPITEKD